MSLLPCDADGYAIPAADLLSDFLAEHGDDPLEGPPEDWPAWCDDDHWAITDQATLAELRQVERTNWDAWLAGPGGEVEL
jgi:hypothetical protein